MHHLKLQVRFHSAHTLSFSPLLTCCEYLRPGRSGLRWPACFTYTTSPLMSTRTLSAPPALPSFPSTSFGSRSRSGPRTIQRPHYPLVILLERSICFACSATGAWIFASLFRRFALIEFEIPLALEPQPDGLQSLQPAGPSRHPCAHVECNGLDGSIWVRLQ